MIDMKEIVEVKYHAFTLGVGRGIVNANGLVEVDENTPVPFRGTGINKNVTVRYVAV